MAGARELDDTEGLKEAEERVDLRLIARDFDDERVGGEVDDFGAKHIRDLQQLRAGAGVSAHFHEHKLAGDGLAFTKIGDINDVDQLAQLLGAEAERGLIAL